MEDEGISFVSFGLVVLDEIRFPHCSPLTNVLGGSGAYATLGARLFLRPPQSRSLAWPIHIGKDFPDPIAEVLHSWDTTLFIERESDKPSTRGLLEYQDATFGPKKFKYTTPILEMDESKLLGTVLLTSKVYHYLASPQDLKPRIALLLALRRKGGILHQPLIIWEPAPHSCTPENLQACLEAAALVDVFSPNHIELAAFFPKTSPATGKSRVESLARAFLESGVGHEGNGAVVIRAGETGCLVQSRSLGPNWLPPFYSKAPEEEKEINVVDPTGAGNAFLGGFAVGFLQAGGDLVEAASYGCVAASFAIEQVGMPQKSKTDELWNGASVIDRLWEYRAKRGIA